MTYLKRHLGGDLLGLLLEMFATVGFLAALRLLLSLAFSFGT